MRPVNYTLFCGQSTRFAGIRLFVERKKKKERKRKGEDEDRFKVLGLKINEATRK